jgi:hypothetical protein
MRGKQPVCIFALKRNKKILKHNEAKRKTQKQNKAKNEAKKNTEAK